LVLAGCVEGLFRLRRRVDVSESLHETLVTESLANQVARRDGDEVLAPKSSSVLVFGVFFGGQLRPRSLRRFRDLCCCYWAHSAALLARTCTLDFRLRARYF
jgi:hypothetical protein